MSETKSTAVELWGGIECTINRVGDRYSSQCEMSGHFTRLDDLRRFAELGIKKLRYPVLWENVAPDSLDEFQWEGVDARLEMIRSTTVTPILGLLHHGSGPPYTSLLDPEFPEKLARYAKAVAERYPWAEWYTPVNEPNTTARFSCLYGVWYPHSKSDRDYVRALYNQVKATILSMRSIREVNPHAKLVQTEDLGRAQSTLPLIEQARFENERRWLTFDLLLGYVDEEHPLYWFLTGPGELSGDELRWLRENACEPDIIGINHYLLSNRFLDHRLELYPGFLHGTNGFQKYADVGAVDTGQTVPPAPKEILRDVWNRYRRPFAVTEAHIAGYRESQMRWLHEIWTAAKELREEGAPIEAVTAWSLLGAYDWNSLCVACNGNYESGVFDLRSPAPRATALVRQLQAYAHGRAPDHPVLERKGFWHDKSRVIFAPSDETRAGAVATKASRPLAITGATGTLGRAFARLCERRGIDYVLLSRKQMDIASIESVRENLELVRPWAVINAAGYVRVDEAEAEFERCHRENSLGPQVLATVCSERSIPLLTFSSDLVFDGTTGAPYRESHPVSPINNYGKSKAEMERHIFAIHPRTLIVRTSSFFGPWDENNFLHLTLRTLKAGELVKAPSDTTVSPTYIPDLAATSLDLLLDGETGIAHLTNRGSVSWAEWALMAADKINSGHDRIVPVSMEEMSLAAPRPKYSVLESERFDIMPPLNEALERYFKDTASRWN